MLLRNSVNRLLSPLSPLSHLRKHVVVLVGVVDLAVGGVCWSETQSAVLSLLCLSPLSLSSIFLLCFSPLPFSFVSLLCISPLSFSSIFLLCFSPLSLSPA